MLFCNIHSAGVKNYVSGFVTKMVFKIILHYNNAVLIFTAFSLIVAKTFRDMLPMSVF
jgi:hypothetical protein